jgi:hypothetical protein
MNSDMMQKLVPNRKLGVGVNGVQQIDVTSDEGMAEFEQAIASGKKFTDIRLEFVNHRGDHFVVKGYGAASGVRGSKEMGRRPQLAVFDDVLSDTDAKHDRHKIQCEKEEGPCRYRGPARKREGCP